MMVALAAGAAYAAESPETAETENRGDGFHVNVAVDGRMDFDYTHPEVGRDEGNFKGKYLNLIVNAQITNNLSVNLRQRLNKFDNWNSNVFAATDFLTLDWKVDDNWTLSGGKQVVALGGFEYNQAPINVFAPSMTWNNIYPYEFGVSGQYTFKGGKHSLLAQFCNSPYTPLNKIGGSMFAYNLLWTGHMGVFHTLWSVSALEYDRGKYGNYICLGNRLDFRNLYFQLDLQNRYTGHQAYLFGDYSVIAKFDWQINNQFEVFVKGGYEKMRRTPGLKPTTDEPLYGGGLLFYPLKKHHDNLRLHLVADMSHDLQTAMRTQTVSLGMTAYVDIFKK